MAKTMFSDEVVLATDLKRRQRYWFDRARETGGVTIVQGLEDWQATADAHRNPELMEAWHSRGRPEDYVPMEAPMPPEYEVCLVKGSCKSRRVVVNLRYKPP